MLRDAYQLLAREINELKREIVELQKDKASNVRPAAKLYHVNTPPADTPAASTYDPAKDPRAIPHQTMTYSPHKKTWEPN